MAKLSFLAGFGAGYVLGTRAGRERYEQIRRSAAKIKENPTVQEAAGVLQAQAGGLVSTAKDDPRLQSIAGMAQARADDAVSSLKSKMGSDSPR